MAVRALGCVTITKNYLRQLMVERDNLQPSWFWRHPPPKIVAKPTKVIYLPKKTKNIHKVEYLVENGWKEKLRLWKDPITGELLSLNRAYYTQIGRES